MHIGPFKPLSHSCLDSDFLFLRRVAPAIASSYSRAGVIVNFVTATGGDVEMLRSIECFYKCVAVLLCLTPFTDGFCFELQDQMREFLPIHCHLGPR
jgi:hypothetical protein